MESPEPLHFVMDLPIARDRVWAAWTDPSELATWLCQRATVQPVVGGPFELFWNPDVSRPESDSTIGCRVLSVDRPRLLQFTWRGSDEVADVMNRPGAPVTEVTVELFPTLDGTRLEITHTGWGSGPGWERARCWFSAAWSHALEALRGKLAG